MNKFAAVSVLTYLFVCACKTGAPSAETALNGRAVQVKVVCSDNSLLKQDVLYRLKTKQGQDIMTRDLLGELEIVALFPIGRTPLFDVQNLQTDLKQMPGVISVDLSWSVTPVDGGRPVMDGLGRPLNTN